MDLTQSLRHTENSLRDFIALVMYKEYGEGWEQKAGINSDDIKKWERTKRREEGKQKSGGVEPRLIYYADFDDLTPILEANWINIFHAVFDVDWSTASVWLKALHLVRNQEAHGREILEHHQYSAIGAAGEIRTRLIRYRSKMETAEDYFPRIERVNDDLGNVWSVGAEQPVKTPTVLRPDDIVTFTIIASDPQGSKLEYCVISPHLNFLSWQNSNLVYVEIIESDIRREAIISVYIRSAGDKYHAHGHWDDKIEFQYTVLPKK